MNVGLSVSRVGSARADQGDGAGCRLRSRANSPSITRWPPSRSFGSDLGCRHAAPAQFAVPALTEPSEAAAVLAAETEEQVAVILCRHAGLSRQAGSRHVSKFEAGLLSSSAVAERRARRAPAGRRPVGRAEGRSFEGRDRFPSPRPSPWRQADKGIRLAAWLHFKDLRPAIALGQGDAEDHQGDADGRRGQASARQEAAEAARPYSERMAQVLANISAAVEGLDAPALMTGTGKDDVHLIGRRDRRARPVWRFQLADLAARTRGTSGN